MKQHKLTGTLYRQETENPWAMVIIDTVEENFFSFYNAHRRKSELEYLKYSDVKLEPVKGTNRSLLE